MCCAWLFLIFFCFGCQNTPEALAFVTTEYDTSLIGCSERACHSSCYSRRTILPKTFICRIEDRCNPFLQGIALYRQRQLGQWLVDGSVTLLASAINNLRLLPLGEILGKNAKQLEPSFDMAFYFNPEQHVQ
jgi:ABC-2 type transport system permease protein